MAIRIIDSKKVDMTDDEWVLYQKIVKSYTTPTNRGEDLFKELFVTDDQGIITQLIAPSKRYTTFEVFLFLMSLQQQQSLRLIYSQVSDICQQMMTKMAELDEKVKKKSSKK